MNDLRPPWCPNKTCTFIVSSNENVCIGGPDKDKMPERPEDDHRFCFKGTTPTGKISVKQIVWNNWQALGLWLCLSEAFGFIQMYPDDDDQLGR